MGSFAGITFITPSPHHFAFNPMESIDTLITARWIIPIEPAGLVLENHAVAVHRGQIVAVLPAAQARARFAADASIERPTHVLLPGFVNAHTRAAMTLLRGAAESSSERSWTGIRSSTSIRSSRSSGPA